MHEIHAQLQKIFESNVVAVVDEGKVVILGRKACLSSIIIATHLALINCFTKAASK